jgi:hypothetical protein
LYLSRRRLLAAAGRRRPRLAPGGAPGPEIPAGLAGPIRLQTLPDGPSTGRPADRDAGPGRESQSEGGPCGTGAAGLGCRVRVSCSAPFRPGYSENYEMILSRAIRVLWAQTQGSRLGNVPCQLSGTTSESEHATACVFHSCGLEFRQTAGQPLKAASRFRWHPAGNGFTRLL